MRQHDLRGHITMSELTAKQEDLKSICGVHAQISSQPTRLEAQRSWCEDSEDSVEEQEEEEVNIMRWRHQRKKLEKEREQRKVSQRFTVPVFSSRVIYIPPSVTPVCPRPLAAHHGGRNPLLTLLRNASPGEREAGGVAREGEGAG